jgi:hypothetical protein
LQAVSINGATFGTEGGIPVYVTREWAPGVELVHEMSEGGWGAHYTPVSEYRPGMKVVMLDGDGLTAQQRMLQGSMLAAAQAARRLLPAASAAAAAQAGGPASQIALFLLG